MSYIFLFPGQGAQYPGMGQDLYQNFASVRELFQCASDIALLDFKKLLFEGSEEQLKQTHITQPGVTLINLSVATVLREKGLNAAATAGHSLGEYSALWYAGVLSTEDVFRSVVERGKLMDKCAQQLHTEIGGGGMAAVLGLEYEDVATAILPMQDDGKQIYIANHNATKQIVIAGSNTAIAEAEAILDEAGAMKYVILKVSGPFHTPLMKQAAEELAPFLRHKLQFNQPKLSLYSNVTGQKIEAGNNLIELELQQIYSPVRWLDIEKSLKADGYGQALEIGPGTVLCGLWKQFLRKEPCIPLGTVAQIEAFVQ